MIGRVGKEYTFCVCVFKEIPLTKKDPTFKIDRFKNMININKRFKFLEFLWCSAAFDKKYI